MRDGNSSQDTSSRVNSATFRPSYEGWKHGYLEAKGKYYQLLDLPMRDGNFILNGKERHEIKTFRPSYEGWKPRREKVPVYFVGTFRPSYEGWKPVSMIAFAMDG